MKTAGSGLAVSFCILSMLFAGGCGGSDQPSQERINSERRDAAQQAKQEERIKQLEREQSNLKKQGGDKSGAGSSGGATGGSSGGTSAGSGRTQCGGGLAVGANTSCPFAQSVRAAYFESGRATTFTAHSTVTGQDYSMSCTSGSPHVCTGGNSASVYFP